MLNWLRMQFSFNLASRKVVSYVCCCRLSNRAISFLAILLTAIGFASCAYPPHAQEPDYDFEQDAQLTIEPPKKTNVVLKGGPSEKERLDQALGLLKAGKFGAAEGLLKTLAEEETTPDKINQEARFFLGVIKLFEMDGPADMKACADVFEKYGKENAKGPFSVDALEIAKILNKNVAIGIKERAADKAAIDQFKTTVEHQKATIDQANRRIAQLEDEVQKLKYQIDKLEEIQKETEKKRQTLRLE